MRDHWQLPEEQDLPTGGDDWLLLLIAKLDGENSSRWALLLWRTWHVRNEMVHNSKFCSCAS